MSGRVYNVVDADETRYNGELTIENSTIDRGADTRFEFTYGALVNGTLTADGNTVIVDAAMLGDFTGTNHQYVKGFVGGTVNINGSDLSISSGAFVGER